MAAAVSGRRGKVLLRYVCLAARDALGRPRGRRRARPTMTPLAQLVKFTIIINLGLLSYVIITII